MNGSDRKTDDEVAYSEFDTSEATPNTEVVRTVAELEGVDPSEIPTLYGTVDHLLEHLFSDPPAVAAQARIEFTYAGYRIAVNQDGRASFRKVE